MGKRYTVLAGMISLIATVLAWQFMDEGWIPSDSFAEKLAVAFGIVIVTWMAQRLIIGKKEEGIHL